MEMKLNLGCGTDYRKGYINVDVSRNIKVDALADLNLGLPFKDDVFEEVLLIDVLEHLNNPDKLIDEIYRVCKSKAKVIIRAPHFTSQSAYADMQHKRGFSIRVFDDYTGETRWSFQFKSRYNIRKRMIIFPKGKMFWNHIVEKLVNSKVFMQNLYENTFMRCLFPADSVILS